MDQKPVDLWGVEAPKLAPPDEVLRILRKLPDDEGQKIYNHIRYLSKRVLGWEL